MLSSRERSGSQSVRFAFIWRPRTLSTQTLTSRNRSLLALLGVCAVYACSPPTDAGDRVLHTRVAFATRTGTSQLPPGPFVSVADSIDVRATSAAGAEVFAGGLRLRRYDTTATIPFQVPEGSTTFAARVLSSNQAVLFTGSATQAIDADGQTVAIPLAALLPVLVVLPDTATTSTITRTQFTVYNGGTGSLLWSVLGDTAFAACQFCRFTPTGGTVGAKQSTLVTIIVPSNLPTRTFSFVFRSAQGDVTAVWRYTISPIVSVTITPSDSIVLPPGVQQQLTAIVQVTGNASQAVTWSSSNTLVATVSSTGLVRGAGAGTSFITARSVVDTTKSARVTVLVPIP